MRLPTGHLRVAPRANASHFHAHAVACRDLSEAAEVLTFCAAKPHLAAVLGEPTEYAVAEQAAGRDILRRKISRPDQPATLSDRRTSLFPADVDDYRLDDPDRLRGDPTGVVEAIIADLLPHEFHNVTTFWQASGSCGFVPGVAKFHLWFELATAWTCAEMHRFVDTLALTVDRAIYQPHQLIFTANAMLGDGVVDPLPSRHGWLFGERDVVVLEPLPPAPAYAGTRVVSDYVPDDAAICDALMRVGDGPGRRGFHEPLRRAAYLYARQVAATGERDDASMIALMASVTLAAPSHDGRNADRADQRYLRQLISSALTAIQAEAAHA